MADDLTVVESKPLPDLSVVSSQPLKPSFGEGMAHASAFRAASEQLGKLADWAAGKADKKDIENLTSIAHGGQGNSVEAYSPRAGYDLLARTSRMLSGAISPQGVATAGGIALANTNPITGIPVDAALVAHGGYNAATNAPEALQGNPEAAERALLGASEATGGAAGFGAQVNAVPGAIRSISQYKPQLQTAGEVIEHPLSIPRRLADMLPDTPEQAAIKSRMADEAKAAEINKARAMQDIQMRREAAQKTAAARQAAAEGKPVPITQSPAYDPEAYKAGRAQLTPAEAAEAQRVQKGSGISVVPEPRAPFPGENPNYMASVPRGTLEDLALARKPGAGVQLQQLAQRPILYAPSGADISNVKSSVSLSDLMASRGQEISLRPNASGESGASMEAINRAASERAVGAKRVRIDTRSGNEVPLIGADAVDAKAGPYDQIVIRDRNGNETILDQGARAITRRPKQ